MRRNFIRVLMWGLPMTLAVGVQGAPAPSVGASGADTRTSYADAGRIASLLDEMKTADLATLAPLPAARFVLPPAGVDVMRVRLDETYEISGIGRDTVELTGWIAARHDNARPAPGETETRWGTAVVDTEFVGMELRGHSKVFGPVLVRLDPQHRSRGQVGKLDIPFVEQIALEAAYRSLRPTSSETAFGPTMAAAENDKDRGKGGTPEDEKAVSEVMHGVWRAISNRDAKGLLQYYARGSKTAKGGEEEVAKQFANVKSIAVKPNDDLQVKFMGRFANVTATGTNEVVDNEGNRGSSQWKANVQLENQGRWLITQDRTSLFPNPGGTMGGREGKCLARISVTVEMEQLALHMTTESPVTWYSEVDTIPPVGYTASVSATPTRMMFGERQVATLQHGTVKFREIVRRVPLAGTTWTQVAAKR